MMNKIKIFLQAVAVSCLCFFQFSCKVELDRDRRYYEPEDQQIAEFVDKTPDLSISAELLYRSGYYHLLNSYGNYTYFAPTNAAWNAYLSSIGKSSITDLSDAECLALYDFHVLNARVDLKAYNTGLLSLADTTMSGMRHFVDISGGFSNIVINKNVNVQTSLSLPNGYLYVTDRVFAPRQTNVFDYLQTGGFSIFAAAIEAVGMKDTLQSRYLYHPNNPFAYEPRWTVLAEPDAVFQSAGINSLEDLKQAVWNRSDGYDSSPEEALKEFVRYHILFLWQPDNFWGNQKMTTVMYNKENLRTYAHNKSRVLNVSASNPLNPDPVINGTVKINLQKSDLSFLNGVVHELANVMHIDKTLQVHDYVLYCGEVFTTRRISRTLGVGYSSTLSELVPYDFDYDNRRAQFNFMTAIGLSSSAYDVFGLGVATGLFPNERGAWIEFYLRNVPSAKYDVYLNYRRSDGYSRNVNAYFRKFGEEYDFTTQRFGSQMNFRNREIDDREVIPEYQQNLYMGRLSIIDENDNELPLEAGDYVMRFVHADMDPAYYDNIILIPVEEE